MTFIDHSVLWVKGEAFEGTLVAIAGVAFILMGIAFWKLGNTAGAKAIVIPIIACGTLFFAAGVYSYVTNSNEHRIQSFQASYAENPTGFVQAEKQRVEGFKSLYQGTLWMALVFFLLAVASHWFTSNLNLRALGMVLALIGSAGLVIDYFSKERADTYYAAIQQELGKL